MKKLLLSIVTVSLCGSWAFADIQTVASLFTGNQNISWDQGGYQVDASQFNDVKVGNYINISYTSASNTVEFKANGQWLPGSRLQNIEGDGEAKCYITEAGLQALQQYGLEVIGAGFNLTSISIMDDGFQMPQGAVWGGYFWIENWNTLEIWKTAFSNYDGQRYMDIYIADDNTNDSYFMKVLTNWDPETLVADNDQIVKSSSVATVDLQNVNLSELLENVNALMIQGNPENGNPFNITAVAFRSENSSNTPGGSDQDPDNNNPNLQNVVTTIYSGDPIAVTWENPLEYTSENFSSLSVGDYIYITFSSTTDVIELKADGTWIPGTIFTNLGEGTPDFKYYVTEAGLAAINEYGLQITGASFSVDGVYICNDGFQMPQGAVWGGYYWIDNNWNTMEIFKTAFSNYNGEKYLDIYLSDDNDGTDYELKVLTNWDPETDIATNDQITHTTSMATVDLSNINLNEWLADVNALMIQGHTEGTPFNITAVALRNDLPDGETTVISVVNSSSLVNIYNLQGQLLRENISASEALSIIPKGIYILKGENGSQKVIK